MLQFFFKHTRCGSSYCYLLDFTFKEGIEIDLRDEKSESPWNDYSGKIWTRNDNSEQHFFKRGVPRKPYHGGRVRGGHYLLSLMKILVQNQLQMGVSSLVLRNRQGEDASLSDLAFN